MGIDSMALAARRCGCDDPHAYRPPPASSKFTALHYFLYTALRLYARAGPGRRSHDFQGPRLRQPFLQLVYLRL